MRSRQKIEKDYQKTDLLILEVLLDIRDLLIKGLKKKRTTKEAKYE